MIKISTHIFCLIYVHSFSQIVRHLYSCRSDQMGRV